MAFASKVDDWQSQFRQTLVVDHVVESHFSGCDDAQQKESGHTIWRRFRGFSSEIRVTCVMLAGKTRERGRDSRRLVKGHSELPFQRFSLTFASSVAIGSQALWAGQGLPTSEDLPTLRRETIVVPVFSALTITTFSF